MVTTAIGWIISGLIVALRIELVLSLRILIDRSQRFQIQEKVIQGFFDGYDLACFVGRGIRCGFEGHGF